MNNLPAPSSKRLPAALLAVALLAAVLFVIIGLTLANYRFSSANAGGNDFIPRWLGTRLLLLEGQNPYGEESSLAIQRFIYGRPAQVNEDQVLFVYPLYASLLFAPYALVGDYILARALWMTTLEITLLLLALFSFRLAGWRPAQPLLALTLLFVLTWYHGARPLINGNPSILMALFVAIAMLAILSGRDILAGPFLALATIKPQAVVLILPLILLWSIARRRFALLVSTLLCLAALVGLAALVEPAWLLQNIQQVSAYPDYTLAGTPAAIFDQWWPGPGRWLGYALTLVIIVALLWQWRLALRADASVLLPVVIFTLAATNLIGVTTAVSNYVALFPGLVLLFAHWRRPRSMLPDWPALLILLLLLVGLWILFWNTRTGRAQSPLMFFPLPMLLLLTLPVVARARFESHRSNGP